MLNWHLKLIQKIQRKSYNFQLRSKHSSLLLYLKLVNLPIKIILYSVMYIIWNEQKLISKTHRNQEIRYIQNRKFRKTEGTDNQLSIMKN